MAAVAQMIALGRQRVAAFALAPPVAVSGVAARLTGVHPAPPGMTVCKNNHAMHRQAAGQGGRRVGTQPPPPVSACPPRLPHRR